MSIPIEDLIFIPNSPSNKSGKYSVADAENNCFNNEYYQIRTITPRTPKPVEVKRKEENNLILEMIPRITVGIILPYIILAIVSFTYYAMCFLRQSVFRPRYRSRDVDYFDEASLTKVVMIQMTILLIAANMCLFYLRRLFMSIHILISFASIGLVVMFLLKLAQVFEGKMGASFPLPLIAITILLICAIIHNIVFYHLIYLKMMERDNAITSGSHDNHPASHGDYYSIRTPCYADNQMFYYV